MTDTAKLNELIKEAAQGLKENDLAQALSYLKSIKWINANPGRCPEAEQKRVRINDIINGKTDGTPEEVAILTVELENCIAAAVWGMKE